jgi:hypothetical protein
MIDRQQLEEIRERWERLRTLVENRRPDDEATRLRYVAPSAMVAGDVPALLADREELIALLREVDRRAPECPLCGELRETGHTPACPLAAALR